MDAFYQQPISEWRRKNKNNIVRQGEKRRKYNTHLPLGETHLKRERYEMRKKRREYGNSSKPRDTLKGSTSSRNMNTRKLKKSRQAPTKGHRTVSHEDHDEGADEEVEDVIGEADHVVGDGDEGEGVDDVEGQLRNHLGYEVDVGAIHPVEVLAKEEWQLCAERLRGGKEEGLVTGSMGVREAL